jgi:hypothetical protein
MPKYAMTVPVDTKLHQRFAQACKVESLTLAKGFEIALECIMEGEVPFAPGKPDGKPVCFNVSIEARDAFRKLREEHRRDGASAATANGILTAALNNGFGGPIQSA